MDAELKPNDLDRKAAWPYADFHCLPDRQMRDRWFSGYYDNQPQGAAIQAFAQHRLTAERDALERAVGDLDTLVAERKARKLPNSTTAIIAQCAARIRLRAAKEQGNG